MTEAGDCPFLAGWSMPKGADWIFHRRIAGTHNTSAPDIRVRLID
jgi:hypothetical protein